MLYLIWFFLVGSIVIMIADMMLEEWAGMDVVEGGAWLLKRFKGTGSGVKHASKSAAKPKAKAKGKR